ncbi:MAG: GntR family transcriptional regulator [Candidatus Methylomirabilales bacterium]
MAPSTFDAEPASSAERFEHQNLEEKIYDRLKAMIMDRRLRPGARIRLSELGREMGVSRTPMLNALKRLSAERLVEWVSRHGIYVRRFTTQEMVELYQVRVALEGLAARLAAEWATPQDVDRLEALFRDVDTSETPEALRRYMPLDREFHWRIVELSRNRQLAAALQSIHMQIFAYQDGIARTIAESVPEHLEFLKALRARDGETCERLMREHHGRAVERLRRRAEAEAEAQRAGAG